MGSVFTNKYSEGYPGRRYYEGQQVVDRLEPLAVERAKALFGVEHANVQPYSGSPANLAVYLAFAEPGDTVMGMALPMGGHLTHGWNVSITGKWFRPVHYGVRRDTGRVDLDEVRELALQERPKLIFCGGTAIPRTIDFEGFADDRPRGRRRPGRRHRPHRRADRRRRPSLAGRARRRDLDHHPQDAARPARRDADVRRRARRRDRPRRLPRASGRPAQPHDGGDRGRARGGAHARRSPTTRARPSPTRRRSPRRWPSAASTSSPAGPTTICCSST